jgi:SAM-dependent MidA family methyltransferase
MMNTHEFFKQKIQNMGQCPFHEYMHMALYHPQYGYYTTKEQVIGSSGDFITAPELSPLFGRTLASQSLEILGHLPASNILELGAGTGRLCMDILMHLELHDALPDTYFILEVSATLRARQQQLLKDSLPHLIHKVQWLTEWPQAFVGVILANEVLDAMPVHRFMWSKSQVFESHIIWNEQKDKLEETFLLSQNKKLINHVLGLKLAPDTPYCSEVNLWLSGWISGLNQSLKQGVAILFDYGFPRHEYYHADRAQGTLMCHERHRAHPDFLYRPGMQDITAHVDFTHVAEEAHAQGLNILGYTHQAAFLLSNGILDLLAQEQDERRYQRHSQDIKLLLQSHEMGEIFKVMALGKDFDERLTGFMFYDKRVSL